MFEGDDELGVGLDDEAVEGVAVRRGAARSGLLALPRSENFWAGRKKNLRKVRGAVPGPRSGLRQALDDLPGGENERFLEYWNLVFMQYDQ